MRNEMKILSIQAVETDATQAPGATGPASAADRSPMVLTPEARMTHGTAEKPHTCCNPDKSCSSCRAAALALAIAGLLFAAGCTTPPAGDADDAKADPRTVAAADDKPGSQLWAENCTRCHNLRSPADFTPAQWKMVVHEMRIRAGLTGEEQRRILAFLQSSSK